VIATPAVDVRQGRCVQLVGGRPEEELVSLPDPVETALDWARTGFRALHVVDLDAALGEGHNRALVRELCGLQDVDVQVGGGLRDDEAVEDVLAAGAERAIVGTRAVDDRDWLERLARRHRGRIVVAADVRAGLVLRRGWTEESDLKATKFVRSLKGLPLAGILCTDVGREGRQEGIDRKVMIDILDASPHPVWASGGITTMDDLRWLERSGAAGAILGMALYTGTLDRNRAAMEYGE